MTRLIMKEVLCDNYLEGFHIPDVHPSLNEALDYGTYTTEIFPFSSLQLGLATGVEDIFDLPESSPDKVKNVAVYYYWLWPNAMLNFHPWGLSVSVIRPLEFNRIKISFLTYVWKPELHHKGAGAGLDRVEREDEAIIETIQRGG